MPPTSAQCMPCPYKHPILKLVPGRSFLVTIKAPKHAALSANASHGTGKPVTVASTNVFAAVSNRAARAGQTQTET